MPSPAVENALKAYDYYHILELEPGVFTPGHDYLVPGQEVVKEAMSAVPFAGRRVLDIGCRDGLFSFLAEKMGARDVIGIDNDLSKAAVEFLIPHFGSSVRMHEMNVNDLSKESFGLFDVVLFPGVLYHLRYPFWALRNVISVMAPGAHLILETGILDGLEDYALLYCPIRSESPYEGTSITFYNVKGLADTLLTLGVRVRRVDFLNDRFPDDAPVPTGKGAKLPTNRATFTCELAPAEAEPGVIKYWEGVHNFHTAGKF